VGTFGGCPQAVPSFLMILLIVGIFGFLHPLGILAVAITPSLPSIPSKTSAYHSHNTGDGQSQTCLIRATGELPKVLGELPLRIYFTTWGIPHVKCQKTAAWVDTTC